MGIVTHFSLIAYKGFQSKISEIQTRAMKSWYKKNPRSVCTHAGIFEFIAIRDYFLSFAILSISFSKVSLNFS